MADDRAIFADRRRQNALGTRLQRFMYRPHWEREGRLSEFASLREGST